MSTARPVVHYGKPGFRSSCGTVIATETGYGAAVTNDRDKVTCLLCRGTRHFTLRWWS